MKKKHNVIRISEGAYRRILELKEEQGISMVKLIDDMVVSYSSGAHFDKLGSVIKLANSKEEFIEALNEVMKKLNKGVDNGSI